MNVAGELFSQPNSHADEALAVGPHSRVRFSTKT